MTDTLRDFKPTAEQINALPERIRNYIHELESNCDPAGIIAENTLVKDQNEMLALINASLTSKVNLLSLDDHILHGGWKCAFCGFDGQNNVSANMFCVSCRKHK